MAMNSVEAVINHSLTISNMIADEREQERTEPPDASPRIMQGQQVTLSMLLESPAQQMKLKKP